MNYIVYDLECTAFMNVSPCPPQEIIEIGAVKINEQLEIIDTFSIFVKPAIEPILHGYIKKFTKITQEDVDNAPSLQEAINNFLEWIGEDYVLCAWTKDDPKYFRRDCTRKNIALDWLENRSIVIQQKVSSFLNCPKGQEPGLKRALDMLEIERDLPMHRAINDALYTAKIFIKTFECYFPKKDVHVA